MANQTEQTPKQQPTTNTRIPLPKGVYVAGVGIGITILSTIYGIHFNRGEYARQQDKISKLSSEVSDLTQTRDNATNYFQGKTLANITNEYELAIIPKQKELEAIKKNPEYQRKKSLNNYIPASIAGGLALALGGCSAGLFASTKKRD